jgi:hypothetical protein
VQPHQECETITSSAHIAEPVSVTRPIVETISVLPAADRARPVSVTQEFVGNAETLKNGWPVDSAVNLSGCERKGIVPTCTAFIGMTSFIAASCRQLHG